MRLIKNIIIYSTSVSPLLLIFLILIIPSCLTIKPSAVKSGKKLYETFFVGEEGTQYFIKPLIFETIDSEDNLQIDFTFRYKNELNNIATINYSIVKDEIMRNVDSLIIISPPNKVTCSVNKLLFNEKRNKSYNSRFTTKISSLMLNNLFKSNEWEIKIHLNNKKYIFYPSRKTKKGINKINNNLFVLFE